MTDEEKAEEYLHCNDRICRAGYLNKVKCKTCTRKQDYLAGLKEGKKKEADLIFESWCKGSGDEECGFLKKLEKENTELRAQVEQLSNDNHVLKTGFITQQEQIEKMRCCRNCLYENDDEELVKEMKNNQDPCIDCKKLNYKNWRLYK